MLESGDSFIFSNNRYVNQNPTRVGSTVIDQVVPVFVRIFTLTDRDESFCLVKLLLD